MQKIYPILTLMLLMVTLTCFSAVQIGVPIYDPPFSVNDPVSGPRGADINLMNEVCKRLAWTCSYTPMRYFDLYPALLKNQVDFVIGSLVITSDKKTEFSFSIPYLVAKGSFLVLASSKVESVEDLKGQSVGALTGRVYIDYLQQNFIGELTTIPFEDQSNMVLALKSEKIAAIFINHLSAAYLQNQHSDIIKILPEEYNVGEGLGIAATLENNDKIDEINKVLLQIQSDGTFIKLYNTTFEFISQSSSYQHMRIYFPVVVEAANTIKQHAGNPITLIG
ncbi:arginine ABC transporter substrate-binding protein (plasmid) [Legionella adelaidensis]|uniref:Arginine ABC transporter substrate-binding protein n=1 Tax=Legionella adelaidensis TaxID=45056 RepID=A0A0W0R432_9GAMM|nr:transporter substrate-binding domain-containing protein [Legionella adelaidensis]KTC65839.1 arginine ABC transporter substrate-binding protein [Legionella adelaidensis]VEH85269.1 arginine ABC transporter substrate-binding protein [Legionella adelaidensis]